MHGYILSDMHAHKLIECCAVAFSGAWVQLTSTWACAGDVVLAMGKRPGTAQGLAAANQASGLGYASRASIALTDLSNR